MPKDIFIVHSSVDHFFHAPAPKEIAQEKIGNDGSTHIIFEYPNTLSGRKKAAEIAVQLSLAGNMVYALDSDAGIPYRDAADMYPSVKTVSNINFGEIVGHVRIQSEFAMAEAEDMV